MSFKESLADDAKNVFLDPEEHGEPIKYKGVNITAIVDRGDTAIKGNTYVTEGHSSRAVIIVSAIDVPDPAPNDEIEFDNKTWYMARVLSSDGIMHELEAIDESAW